MSTFLDYSTVELGYGLYMKQPQEISDLLQRMVASAEWVFAIGVRIRFNNPTLLFRTYPELWIEHYDKNGLLFKDPTVRWGLMNTGMCDWEDLKDGDAHGVLEEAAGFGLKFGIAISTGDAAERTLGYFARGTEPFSEDEKQRAQGFVQELHDFTAGLTELPAEKLAAYRVLGEALKQTV